MSLFTEMSGGRRRAARDQAKRGEEDRVLDWNGPRRQFWRASQAVVAKFVFSEREGRTKVPKLHSPRHQSPSRSNLLRSQYFRRPAVRLQGQPGKLSVVKLLSPSTGRGRRVVARRQVRYAHPRRRRMMAELLGHDAAERREARARWFMSPLPRSHVRIRPVKS